MKSKDIILRVAFIWLLPYHIRILCRHYKKLYGKVNIVSCLKEAWDDWWHLKE